MSTFALLLTMSKLASRGRNRFAGDAQSERNSQRWKLVLYGLLFILRDLEQVNLCMYDDNNAKRDPAIVRQRFGLRLHKGRIFPSLFSACRSGVPAFSMSEWRNGVDVADLLVSLTEEKTKRQVVG